MIELRRMKVSDAGQVRAIEESTSETPWSFQTFIDCVEVGYDCWVQELDKSIVVSFGLMSAAAEQAHILNIAVDEPWQGQGLGRQMMNHLIQRAKACMAKSIYLEVRVSNSRAIKLYEDLGFKKISIRKDYYGTKAGGREDAMVLELFL